MKRKTLGTLAGMKVICGKLTLSEQVQVLTARVQYLENRGLWKRILNK